MAQPSPQAKIRHYLAHRQFDILAIIARCEATSVLLRSMRTPDRLEIRLTAGPDHTVVLDQQGETMINTANANPNGEALISSLIDLIEHFLATEKTILP